VVKALTLPFATLAPHCLPEGRGAVQVSIPEGGSRWEREKMSPLKPSWLW